MKPDLWLIVLDETENWTLPYGEYIKRVEQVYLLDASIIVHLCEFAGSYECWEIEARAVFKDDTPGDVIDEVDGDVQMSDTHNIRYFHEHSIDLKALEDKGKAYHYGDPGLDLDLFESDEDPYLSMMDAMEEHFRCNAVI